MTPQTINRARCIESVGRFDEAGYSGADELHRPCRFACLLRGEVIDTIRRILEGRTDKERGRSQATVVDPFGGRIACEPS